ncbi:crossover junction endonuclease EME1B isoform X2 [Magnolia sinica]|uniref:crossover junction endonuclease EME1B isoform X2 n=1 Tax=Magnolia sinica TaxID=86752 RepID=UPI00265A7920|nr:crossover junction endonuclease EME1B isoform X2 [Magnolia sinica]
MRAPKSPAGAAFFKALKPRLQTTNLSHLPSLLLMAEPLAVEIPSDDEDVSCPSQLQKKKRKNSIRTPLLILDDDDSTPSKPTPSFSPSFVPETPFSNPFQEDASIVKCTASDPRTRLASAKKFSGFAGLICLESDNEFECHSPCQSSKENETRISNFGRAEHSKKSVMESSSIPESAEGNNTGLCFPTEGVLAGPSSTHSPRRTTNIIQIVGDSPRCSDHSSEDAVPQVHYDHNKENAILEQVGDAIKQKDKRVAVNAEKKRRRDEEVARKQQLKEERKLKREQEKLQKETLKAEAAEMRKLQKEKEKWEKGKFAVKSVVAEIDTKVVEIGSIGGHLLSRLAEKGLTFRVTSNPIESSILWKMSVPDQISQLTLKGSEVPYVLLVYEAEEFCNLILNESLIDHVRKVQRQFPSYTICYVTNRLMAYINKREQVQYKNPMSVNGWRRPPVEEVLSKLTTHFESVHSRQCIDEAELAEHVVGLTCSLATCQFRKKLTRLSVNANGSLIPKDFIDKHLIKKSVWLKALIAIPKVQPRFAIAIWKKYPTMRSLLNAYMDPSKSVHEKEFLLKDLMTEGPLGREDRRVGEVCSKRVYRILMAQNGNMKTDDVEDGADFFGC